MYSRNGDDQGLRGASGSSLIQIKVKKDLITKQFLKVFIKLVINIIVIWAERVKLAKPYWAKYIVIYHRVNYTK